MPREWLEITQSASVVVASSVAIYGINAWRREFVGKRRMELAEEVLALFYQARDIIFTIRSPSGYPGEGQSREPVPNESPEDKEARDQAYVLIERYKKHSELFSRLQALRYRFMVQVGVEEAKPFDDLNRVVRKLLLASHKMARLLTRRESSFRDEVDREKHKREIIEVEKLFYAGEDDDSISVEVDKLIADMETTCKRVIQGRLKLLSRFGWKRRRKNG